MNGMKSQTAKKVKNGASPRGWEVPAHRARVTLWNISVNDGDMTGRLLICEVLVLVSFEPQNPPPPGKGWGI